MDSSLVNLYARQADKMDRDPYGPDGVGRATVVNGRGFQKWARFQNTTDVVWVETPEGGDAWLTRKQADLYQLAMTFADGGSTTIRFLARELKCSPSTVSRGMVKLASLGLLAAVTERGRYAALWILRLPGNGLLGRFRVAAKAKVRRWSEASQRRVSRLQRNVASYILEGDRGGDSLYRYLEHVTSTKGATLTEPWTVEEMAEIAP